MAGRVTRARTEPLRIGVLVGQHGRGSNMLALIDACKNGRIDGEVVTVVGSDARAPALDRARSAETPVTVVPGGGDRDYGQRLLGALRSARVDLICLAGYMRLLPEIVVEEFRWRAMNVHPALLPKFGGKGMFGRRVHEAVIAAGENETGCTVHFVDDQYDHGPIILQARVPVLPGDTPETLAARILPLEHETYVRAVELFRAGLTVVDGEVVRVHGACADFERRMTDA